MSLTKKNYTYRITAVVKVETDIIVSITEYDRMSFDTSDNVCTDLLN